MMEGWKEYKIKDFCEFKYGKNLPEKTRITGKYPVYDSSGIVSYHKNYLLKAPGIIVGRKGTVGKVQYSKENFFPIDTTFYIEADKSKVDFKYLYYRLPLCGLDNMNSDAAVPGLNRTAAINQKIHLPPLPTQRKIAKILSAYDDLIENNLKRIKLLEEMAQKTYEEWFVRMKFPGHETTKFNKETGLPEGWKKVKLGEVCELIMGQSPKSEFYNYEKKGLPFHQGVKDYGDRFPTNTMWSTKGNRFAEKGNVLFSVRAPVGRLNIALEKIILGRGLASISYKNWNGFLYYQLKQIFFEDNLMGGGAIFNSVTKNDMLRIELIEGDEQIMGKFNEIVEPIDINIENLHNQNQRLKEARDILLPRLMTGVINV